MSEFLRYDDGSNEVPAGGTSPVERVIVVGAGIAGLTVANALGHAGVECVVVEARDRVGGRLHTVDVGGTPVDMGGSWIHTPVGNPMRRFADQVGVACREANPLDALVVYDPIESRRLTQDEYGRVLQIFAEFSDALDDIRPQLGDLASAAEGVDAYLDGLRLEPGPARWARAFIRMMLEGADGCAAEQSSLRWLWSTHEYGGDDLGDMPEGGYRSLVDAMASGVDVRLGVAVTDVLQRPDEVELRAADGTVELGSHVVVTLPLGVLKHGSVSFSPELPPDRLDAVARLGCDRFEKVVLTFTEPFWRSADMPHLVVLPDNPDETGFFVVGLDDIHSAPTLMCLVLEPNADHLEGRTADESAAWALEKVSAAIGKKCPQPVAVAVSAWAEDPYAGGSYAHIPPGASPADVDLLGEPVSERLLFAGEATTAARMGYADGAMSSGIREAKRLLQTPEVVLGPIDAVRL
jgi:monoamine oxidase